MRTTVVIDAANDPRLAKDLTAGGAFVVGYALALSDECDLVVYHGPAQLRLAARVVYVDPVDPTRGAGLEVVGFGAALRDQLAELVRGECTATRELAPATAEPAATAVPVSSRSIAEARRRAGRASVLRPAIGSSPELALGSDVHAVPDEEMMHALDDDDPIARDPAARTVAERVRGLNLAEQIKLAVHGELAERVVLERLYGKNVWEPLLRNPRLTAPEVARIARMGALPRVHLEIITSNNAWLAMPDVRRALLGNPRMSGDQIVKVLRLLPKPELRLVPTQLALPMAVREAAKKLLRGEA